MTDDKDNVIKLAKIRKQIEENTEDAEVYTSKDPYLDRMNEKHAFINSIGGKPMVSSYIYSELFDRDILEFCTPESIMTRYCNEVVPVGKDKIELGRWWIRHAERKEYNTIIFDPSKPREHKGCLNLWEGFSIQPKFKSYGWKLTFRHLYKILCNSDPIKLKYVIKWLAWCVQNPAERAQVSIIFKGKQGAGKGFIFDFFVKIFGQHAMCIANRELLTGKHNGHFQRIVFLFADEAYYPGDKEVEGVMKNLITSPSIALRAMYKDAVMSTNRLHIVQSTNAEWVIPAGDDTRRYFINEVDNKYAKGQINDLTRDLYFSGLYAEMSNGGCEAMLYDLLNMPLYGWNPLIGIPKTEELEKQIRISRNKLQAVLFNIIDEGIFPGTFSNLEYKINATELYNYMTEIEPLLKNVSTVKKSEEIKKLGIKRHRDGKGINWVFPSLKEIRANWDKIYGMYKWDKQEEWQIVKGMY